MEREEFEIDHEEEVGEQFVCHVCTKRYKHESSLNKHLKIHDDEEHPCMQCEKTFRTMEQLKQHKIRTHSEKTTHLCAECGVWFNSKMALNNHVRFKHRQKTLVCPICDKNFKDNYALKRHQESHIKTKKECPKCKQSFRDVVQHLKNCKVHNKRTRQYECDICKKKFLCKRYLQKHLICKHQNPEQYRCTCGKTYSYSSSLRRHERMCPNHST